MKKILITLIAIFFCTSNSYSAKMKLESSDFKSGRSLSLKHVYNGFGCEGENILPQLEILNIPENTKSLALTIFDPDAPTQSGWWHLIAYNISPEIRLIEEGGANFDENVTFGKNDYGDLSYGGPCPPIGTKHRYIFTLYALNIEKLNLPENISAAAISYNLNQHSIKKAVLSGNYHRKK